MFHSKFYDWNLSFHSLYMDQTYDGKAAIESADGRVTPLVLTTMCMEEYNIKIPVSVTFIADNKFSLSHRKSQLKLHIDQKIYIIFALGSVQVIHHQVFTNFGPPPLNHQDHHRSSPLPLNG